MRGVRVRVRVSPRSLLVGIGILAVMAAAEASAVAAAEEAAPPSEAGAAQPSGDDYYTRRAKSVLEAEKAAAVKPHPLAASFPGMDVVVCEAGCPGRAPEVIYLRPQPAAPATSEGMMVPTSGSDDAATVSAVCIAGCYDGTQGAPIPAAAPPAAAVERPWSETIAPRDKLSPIR